MPITRDENYPPEMAQLMQAFNIAADGHDALTVLNASVQMVAAAIGFMAREKGLTIENALDYADHVAGVMKREVRTNWQRSSSMTDIPVKAS